MKFLALFIAVLLVATDVRADTPIDYATRIKPVLQARCFACHGVLKKKSGLRLDTAALAIKGGKGGAAIVPGDAESSTLIDRISSDDDSERMPPEGEPLKPAEIAAIRTWINQGAHAPADERPERDPRDHWAFKTPVRPPVPTLDDPSRSTNPIDAFIGSEYRKHGLTPQGPADKRVWLRRVSIDLVGLPPTRDELDAFAADRSLGAYEKVADRLLDSPQYGERWGRHWMDVWRYSDWWGLGAEVRNSQKHIWHWRDWIIESLNADKGYDQMLREMLAADELYPDDLDRLRASGFLARQYFKFNRTTWLDEAVEHTGKAMLGLTFNCAKCHDHKFDPFSQVEYYRLRAVFEPYQVRTDALPGSLDYEKDGLPRAFDCNLDVPTYLHIRGDERKPDQSRPLAPGFPAFLSTGDVAIVPVRLPAAAAQPGLRPFVVEAHRKAADRKIVDARAALEASKHQPPATPVEQRDAVVRLAETSLKAAEADRKSVDARLAADRTRSEGGLSLHQVRLTLEAVLAERLAAAAKADEVASRAELGVLRTTPEKKAEAAKALAAAKTARDLARKAIDAPVGPYTPLAGALKTLESNLETEESRHKPFPTISTGRRSALARWITDTKNPLTARVAVNHIWARHFGKPLVPTVFDFGRKGTPPTHPELLDWLAVELIDHGWSMKHIHRLIVTSNTYRLASTSAGASKATLAADPENRFYWRANPVRIESEVVRDSLLYLSGDLDLTRGGPSIPVATEGSKRRSLYFVHSHNEHQKFLSIFDDASVLECYRRAESIVPQQALALENSPLATATATAIAARIGSSYPSMSDRNFIREAFLTILAVEPTEAETVATLDALARLTDLARRKGRPTPEKSSRIGLVHALLNHNDFVTVR